MSLTRIFAKLDGNVTAAVAADFAAHAARKAAELVNATLVGDARQIHVLLRAMKPWSPVRQFRLNDMHGAPATSYTQ